MKGAAVSLVFVMGCRFDLPGIGIDAPVDTSGGGSDALPPDGPPACPADYMALPGGPTGHLYKKAPTNQNWTNQDDYCRSTSGRAYLAVPDDGSELTALHTLAGGTSWVGISDRVTEGSYVKVTGGPATFLPWATGAGEPDNPGAGGGQDCIAATATNFSTENCSGTGSDRPAVCECNP